MGATAIESRRIRIKVVQNARKMEVIYTAHRNKGEEQSVEDTESTTASEGSRALTWPRSSSPVHYLSYNVLQYYDSMIEEVKFWIF